MVVRRKDSKKRNTRRNRYSKKRNTKRNRYSKKRNTKRNRYSKKRNTRRNMRGGMDVSVEVVKAPPVIPTDGWTIDANNYFRRSSIDPDSGKWEFATTESSGGAGGDAPRMMIIDKELNSMLFGQGSSPHSPQEIFVFLVDVVRPDFDESQNSEYVKDLLRRAPHNDAVGTVNRLRRTFRK